MIFSDDLVITVNVQEMVKLAHNLLKKSEMYLSSFRESYAVNYLIINFRFNKDGPFKINAHESIEDIAVDFINDEMEAYGMGSLDYYRKNSHQNLLEKMERFIRGSFYGSVFGDACGSPFELRNEVPLGDVLTFFDKRLSGKKTGVLHYTDDSEMALGICESLKRANGFNASDLAKTFSDAFFRAPSYRLYGGSIRSLFEKMSARNFVNPSLIAAAQFNGSGSYGNGGGMRVTPAAIYGLKLSTDDFNKLICDVTAVTHTHPLALYGALLQAHALRRVITLSAKHGGSFEIDSGILISDLVKDLENADLSAYAFGRPSNFHKNAYQQFLDKISSLQKFINQDQRPSVVEVVSKLGNGEPAIEAIPTALYVFLQCLKPLTEIPYEFLKPLNTPLQNV
ncbi:hypothetical protein ACTXT7_001934 [Hymenolepis weldensis]